MQLNQNTIFMTEFENTLFDLVSKYEPDKISYIKEVRTTISTKDKKQYEEVKEKVFYEDAKELAEMSGIATKTITTFLNVKNKVMSQAQASILAKALTNKFGVEVTPEMLLKTIEK